jgi:hypothetical protein
MNWLTDIQDFFSNSSNAAAVMVLAILLVGFVIALIVGGSIASKISSRHIKEHEHQAKASVIAALIDVATEASVWNALSPQEQIISDRAVGQVDIRVRLLPVKGAGIAADWASHQLQLMKRNSATFGYQLDPAVTEFRDRLLLWLNNPGKANKIFTADLERWAYQSAAPEEQLAQKQEEWVAQQHHEEHAAPEPEDDPLAALRPPQDDDDQPGVPKMF